MGQPVIARIQCARDEKIDVRLHLVVVVRLALDDRVARVEVVGALDGEGVVEGARVEREAAAVPSDLKRGERSKV